MIVYKDECVCCGLPCLGRSCSLRHTPHFYCDICREELVETEIAYCDDDYIECINCHEEEEKEQQSDKEDWID